MDVSLQLVGVAIPVPGKLTAPNPWLAPKFEPVMVTAVPTTPAEGDRPVMTGSIVNELPAVAVAPETVTLTVPDVAPVGTGTAIDVALQLVGVASVPLNATVLEPWLNPKFAPLMVIEAPTPPEVGEIEEMEGAGTTVKKELLLKTPPTSTTTFTLGSCNVGVVNTIEVLPQLEGWIPSVPN